MKLALLHYLYNVITKTMSQAIKTTNTSFVKTLITWITVSVFALLSHAAAASLVNLDFSDGFNGWSGEVIVFDDFDLSETLFTGDAASGFFTTFADNYAISGDEVTLSTFFDDNTFLDTFSVTLFQDFTFNLAPDTDVFLDIMSTLSVTDPANDFVEIQIRNLDTFEVLDLTGATSFLLNDWSGVNATLEFTIQNFDFFDDAISISGLAFREESTFVSRPVSSPAVFLLLIGVILLGVKRQY